MHKGLKMRVYSCLLILILSGCKATETSLSTTRLDSPEISGERYDVKVTVGGGTRAEVNLTGAQEGSVDFLFGSSLPAEDTSELAPVITGEDPAPFAKVGLSIAPKWEVSFSSQYDNKLSLKYQFQGDSANTAKKGNYSQAVSFGVALYEDENFDTREGLAAELNEFDIRDDRVIERNFRQDTFVFDLAWIHGYRLTDQFIVYGGPYAMFGNLNGEQVTTIRTIARDDPSDISEVSRNVDLNSDGHMIGANVVAEYQFSFGMLVSLEYSAARIKWEDDSGNASSLAFQFGFQF